MKNIRGIKYTPQGEINSGRKHPDFDDSVLTSVVEFYRRFAANPDFKVNQLPLEYDLKEQPFKRGSAADDVLLNDEIQEPEYGQVDLEYFDPSKHSSHTKPNDEI